MAPAAAFRTPLRNEPEWPESNGRRVVFLLDASSAAERRIAEGWIVRHCPDGAAYELVAVYPTRRRAARVSLAALEECLASRGDVLLAPLRVVWLPRKRDGVRAVRLSDIVRFGDPRDPGSLRQHWILRRERDRFRIVGGEPAPASELRVRWLVASG